MYNTKPAGGAAAIGGAPLILYVLFLAAVFVLCYVVYHML